MTSSNRLPPKTSRIATIELATDGASAHVLDQLALPGRVSAIEVRTAEEMAAAIAGMVVRGAPAIGIAAAMGMVLASFRERSSEQQVYEESMAAAAKRLLAARPTAVNLAWAVRRCMDLVDRHAGQPGDRRHHELAELARRILREDVETCRELGRIGAEHVRRHARGGRLRVHTHCNAGALATGDYGTALGVVRGLVELGLDVQVIADETRPYLQGARLTAWELANDGIEVTVIADAMAAHCMKLGMIDVVVVGADRIAANGDVANKIGTYGLACLAKAHGIPFYVAAPWSTFDPDTSTGEGIPIEQRPREELTEMEGRLLVPAAARAYNPSFDVTPAALIEGILTERGVFQPTSLVNSGA